MSNGRPSELLTEMATASLTRQQSSVLLREAREGSTQAVGSLFDLCGERLLALIRMRLGADLRRQVESRDILQMTFLKAFERIDQFEGSGRQTLVGWLAAIAQNEIRDQVDFHRRVRRDERLRTAIDSNLEDPRVQGAVSRIALREQTRRLERAMESLESAHREVILLRRFEELSWAEIGDRLERSSDAARMLFARAMASLTVRMRGLREEPGH